VGNAYPDAFAETDQWGKRMTTDRLGIKVGVQIRPDHHSKSGGDIALAKAFSQRLRQFGFESALLSAPKQVEDFQPRLLIAFNLDQPLELLGMCGAAKQCGAEVAVYTLHHPREGMRAYLRSGLPGMRGWIARFLGNDPARYIFATALFRCYRRRDVNALMHMLLGRKRLICNLVPLIDELLVSGPSELAAIQSEIPALCNTSALVIPHPVDFPVVDMPDLNPYEEGLWRRHFLVAGRIESRKNQNAVLRVAAQIPDSEFVFAGIPNDSDPAYCAEFRQLLAAAPNCRWLGQLSMAALLQHIACADAVVSPSWFEVMSLINLYAYALGTPVISGLHTFDPDLVPDGVIRYDPEKPQALVDILASSAARPKVDPRAAAASNRVKEFSASTWAGFDNFSLCVSERLSAKS
jgi:glycosyltransferase involved in cell wall biosynthesis